ncbi:MAG: hypothetical protein K6B69_06175 [Lachnospiraceae bacterium]|nr:hypothetical protein [Lachnospiraceae bacterium]
MNYEVQELRRGSDEFIGHGKNPQFRVFALNLPKNQLTQLTEDALDLLFRRLREEFKIKPEDCPIFYLYDRDAKSYKRNELRSRYVKKYTDPYSNETGDQGQLLLSYPAIESFLLSCIRDDVFATSALLGTDAKNILSNAIIADNISDKTNLHQQIVDIVFSDDPSVAENRLLHSVEEMDLGLNTMGIASYDPDHLAPVLTDVYDYQQKKYTEENLFSFFSLVGMAFLELGIIAEVEDDE